jgi:hypothetical protein
MSIVLKKIINEFQLIKNAHRILHSAGTNVVTITCGSDVTGFDAVRVVRGAYGVGGRLSGRGKGVAKQAGVATGGPLLTICTKGGVGTCWRRNPSGTVSVTWRSVPGRFRRGARLDTSVFPVGPGRCGLFLFGAKERGVEGKRDGRGSLTAGRNGPGRREKAGRPGFPRVRTGCPPPIPRAPLRRRLPRACPWH